MTRSLITLGLLAAVALPLPAADEPKGKPPAADLLADGLARAKKEDKRVFLVFGSPSCGWCKVFDRYHADPDVGRVTGRHLVLVKVDVVENAGGQALYKKYGTDRGVPAWVLLGPGAAVLADSGDGQANVGFPYQPHEVAHYLKALRKACPGLSDAEAELLAGKLKEVSPKQ
jgi:hypothetical protein